MFEFYREIEERTMSEQKRKEAKFDFFAFYVGRPMSYLLTYPFLKMQVSPNTISFLSIIVVFIGAITVSVSNSKVFSFFGWLLFFLWNLLDGVDGNIARYSKISSKIGSVWDATSGYFCMFLTFFSMGINVYFSDSANFNDIDAIWFVIMGAFSGFSVILPRLVMHKKNSTYAGLNKQSSLNKKNEYSFSKIVALNLTSVSGFIQIIMLSSLMLDFQDIFTVFYFIVNTIVLIVSLKQLLREQEI
ncbi:CDP-alcohol phosphatidyltransferase family protein [Candidatus Enterococcus murrayae]|uniref:CDP-alcohol phosphatidyltransferase family protein n=1 Tax=Candidatus Enterococcus murrayae TaxID=2815321 RepID=A0ABS3HG89_9ENTE|nr:CDP-alcohol phosphatidyltransferase family protein [Enterococcus sp. MJM16]MBO0452042.1 CDP-alcohol phosphatidyltransferase family protein [Enterococcus sp. MJM16]